MTPGFLQGGLPCFLAVASGVLLVFSFPRFGAGWVAWAALIPLLFALRDQNLKKSFRLGFVTGLIGHVGLLYWISHVVVEYGYLPLYVGVGAMLLVVAYLSLYTGLFALGVQYLRGGGIPLVLSAPVLWTVLEYIKSHVLTGFPWENLGCSQHLWGNLIQFSDITGVYGISFLIVLVNVLLYDLIGRGPRRILKAAALVLVMGLVLAYGVYRSADVAKSLATFPAAPVALIQGNVDQSVKWNPAFQSKTMDDYAALTLEAAPPGGGFVVWPETAVPFFFQDMDLHHRLIVSLARQTGSWLLLGSPSYKKAEDGRTILYNSAYLVSPEGRMSARYDKVHLVPYGEYVPLRRFFPFIGKLVQGVGDFGTGDGYQPLPMNEGRVGVLICYEGIFPGAARAYKNSGADLLVNITNDAWFGRTSAPYQHLSMTVFRAVENRLYLIRAANTGISAVIDPLGRVVSQTGLFEKTFLPGEVRFVRIGTWYGIWGDLFVYLCLVLLAGSLVLTVVKRRKGT